jgi:hypothetical protein
MLNLKELRDYSNWIEITPGHVRLSVLGVGGWQQVFPGDLPRWASKVRNYFNLNPMSLTLCDEKTSRDLVNASFSKDNASALSGQVYQGPHGESIWFQMVPGAAVLHFPGELPSSDFDAAMAAMKANNDGQAKIPVFKLVSPDGTGGSMECVITNNGSTTIGPVNEEVKLADRFVKDPVRLGSYNYAETSVVGLPAHRRLDMITDPMVPGYFFQPHDLFKDTQLYNRRFPDKDWQGKPLAGQTGPAP